MWSAFKNESIVLQGKTRLNQQFRSNAQLQKNGRIIGNLRGEHSKWFHGFGLRTLLANGKNKTNEKICVIYGSIMAKTRGLQ